MHNFIFNYFQVKLYIIDIIICYITKLLIVNTFLS